jgi:hypothetical protein
LSSINAAVPDAVARTATFDSAHDTAAVLPAVTAADALALVNASAATIVLLYLLLADATATADAFAATVTAAPVAT